MAVSKRLRYEILRRDNHTCRYCGATAPDIPLRIDHVIPVTLGGTDDPTNLVTACQDCNSGKSSATTDATVVADITQDALRWAAAMKQAAAELRAQQKPKAAYRSAFEQAWNDWTWEHNGKRKPFGLPPDWKTSLDRFREAGLPVEMWPDIVEKAMTNSTIRADNLFRYCCGIAWRMVGELQERAKTIAGVLPVSTDSLSPVAKAALDVWATEAGEDADDQARASILASVQEVVQKDVDAHLIVESAQYAAWFGLDTIDAAIRSLEHDNVVQKWQFAWLAQGGDYPADTQTERVKRQASELLTAGVYVGRLERAANYAGAHHSTLLHFGLSDEELTVTGVSAAWSKAVEVWSESFHAAADRWPTNDERAAFAANLQRIGKDGDIWIADIFPAAVAAGAYQDPDLGTCITRHLSVFEAASRPLVPAA